MVGTIIEVLRCRSCRKNLKVLFGADAKRVSVHGLSYVSYFALDRCGPEVVFGAVRTFGLYGR